LGAGGKCIANDITMGYAMEWDSSVFGFAFNLFVVV
jgi:hypothetical protein